MPQPVPLEELEAIAASAGIEHLGVAQVQVFTETRRTLLERREEGLHGGMQFTYRNPERSTDPERILPGARSLIVAAMPYLAETPRPPGSAADARVARYVWADNYAELKQALETVADRLREAGWRGRVVADDNALVDREAAHRAGLGWYGKNANLLLPGEGSWFVLGAVVTDAPLPVASPQEDGCGPCRRCLDGCPTGAIVAPGVVDARRCLAWLLQAEGPFPVEFREALGPRIYGCDDCQEVCPPNRRLTPPPASDDAAAWVPVIDLLACTDEELLDRYGAWYIPKRDPRYLRRNALVVLGNIGDPQDRSVVETIDRYLADADPLLGEHAAWAAEQLGIGVH